MNNKVVNLGKILIRRLHNYKNDPFLKKYIMKKDFDKATKMYKDHEKYDPTDPLGIYT
jgi:hypothetical protein